MNQIEKPMTIVVDTSVIIHDLHYKHSLLNHTDPHWTALIKAQLTWIVSGDWLGDLKPKKFQVVFVSDMKPYWRTEYLKKPETVAAVPRKTKKDEKKRERLNELLNQGYQKTEDDLTDGITAVLGLSEKPKQHQVEFNRLSDDLAIHYKAGRKFPEYSFTKLKKLTLEIIRERNWTLLGQKGYEADDIAAAIVKVNECLDSPSNTLLLTIDSDWMGLINHHTSWFCSHGWFPRLRSDLNSVNTWAEKRLGDHLGTFRDIWDIKGQQGDKSDNIPASQGVLLPVIDLLNPPDEHKLWLKPIGQEIEDLLLFPRCRNVDSSKARDYIEALGVNLVVRPLDPRKDLVA